MGIDIEIWVKYKCDDPDIYNNYPDMIQVDVCPHNICRRKDYDSAIFEGTVGEVRAKVKEALESNNSSSDAINSIFGWILSNSYGDNYVVRVTN